MPEYNYSRRETRWEIHHKLEVKQRKYFLKQMSEEDSFRILKELHQFACKLGDKSEFHRVDMDRIKALADVHALFGKLKV